MLSKVNGVFRIASEIELKYLPSGSAVAKVNLVNSSKYKTQSGEQKEDVCFINGTVFGKQAEVLNQYCHKGSKLFVTGQLKQDTWSDQQGNKRSAHSIKIDSFEFLDSKPQSNDNQPQQGYQQQSYSKPQQRPQPNVEVVQDNQPYIGEDEIPFSRGER